MEGSSKSIIKLRQICQKRGATGIIGLSRSFRLIDENRDKKLSLEEFKTGLQDYGADMSPAEIEEIFAELDKDGSGTVSFDEFLRAVRPPLSPARLDMITQAFAKMDKTGDGVITLEDLKGVYTAKEHPDVVAGKTTEEQVLLEFMSTFESVKNRDGKITKDEFLDYYAGVSANIDSEDYFTELMRKAWDM